MASFYLLQSDTCNIINILFVVKPAMIKKKKTYEILILPDNFPEKI